MRVGESPERKNAGRMSRRGLPGHAASPITAGFRAERAPKSTKRDVPRWRYRRMDAQNRLDLSGDIKNDGQAPLKLTMSGSRARRHFRSWRFAADSPPSRKCVMQRRSVVRRHQGMQFRHAQHPGMRTAEHVMDRTGGAWAFPLKGVRYPTHPRRGNAST